MADLLVLGATMQDSLGVNAPKTEMDTILEKGEL
jgi:hypothetical protein